VKDQLAVMAFGLVVYESSDGGKSLREWQP
jgi:hypothetical protein